MSRWLLVCGLVLCGWTSARSQGLLVPADRDVGPLAVVRQDVEVQLEDQVAVTQVTQVFRNPTSQPLEATYLFPVPKEASVQKFTMWVDGKELAGELVEADQARSIYTDVVRRAQDPGLLEHVGSDLLRLRVFPVPAHGEQKLAVRYTALAQQEAGLVEYVCPLRSASPVEKFTFRATLKSQQPLHNVYSPSHPLEVERHGDHKATVRYESSQAVLNKDLQLFYAQGSQDVELTLLPCRPDDGKDGTFLLLLTPRAELAKKQHVARDLVFVLDISGSMQGAKLEQAKKALKFCLGSLDRRDRFTVLSFATTVNRCADALEPANSANVARAQQWVEELTPTGGTAIDAALAAALKTRSSDTSRPFTVVFFTDGLPTVGETRPEQILKNVLEHHTAQTRLFTFGVGDDVHAALLDQLADRTRAVSTYVRPGEDLEVKASNLYGKISRPVLTDLELTVGKGISVSEMYPTRLPDLFHGGQLVVLGRYCGGGTIGLALEGRVGKETRRFVYQVQFPARSAGKSFVVDLWARRKVGYLLEQIRSNGEKKELVDEVVTLAKKHGITTPYTSYLVVPDNALAALPRPAATPPLTQGIQFQIPSQGRACSINYAPVIVSPTIQWAVPNSCLTGAPAGPAPTPAQPDSTDWVQYYGSGGYYYQANGTDCTAAPAPSAAHNLGVVGDCFTRTPADAQTGKLGVDLAVQLNELRQQSQVGERRTRTAAGRTCVEVQGAWIDDGFVADMKQVTVKALSAAYFRLLERQPQLKEVFQLGKRVVWVTPSGRALVIDAEQGTEEMTEAEIDELFVAVP